jgi:hypothetical protein
MVGLSQDVNVLGSNHYSVGWCGSKCQCLNRDRTNHDCTLVDGFDLLFSPQIILQCLDECPPTERPMAFRPKQDVSCDLLSL